jgi:lysozyme
MNLEKMLELHEGKETKPYVDTVGKVTIGIGRNLTDRGLSEDEIQYLFRNDIRIATQELEWAFPWVRRLDEVRKAVLIDMSFNMGMPVLKTFKNTLAAVETAQYEKASKLMLQSKWATQVGNRAKRLSKMMQSGEWSTDL